MLSKLAFLKERALDNLLNAKKHSDNRQYKYKHDILSLMMTRKPQDFFIDSEAGNIAGITHIPTKFKIHVPKKLIPSKVEKKIMPSTSQNQQKLMNWVHAIQKNKAKGPPKINNIAKSMSRDSVEHFMGRGHIDKTLPVKKAFESGFISRAEKLGISNNKAYELFKLALEMPPNPLSGDSLSSAGAPQQPKFNVDPSKPLPGTALNGQVGQTFPQLNKPTPTVDPNAHNSLNTGVDIAKPLPPSLLGGITPAITPGQKPIDPLGPGRGLKSQPGTYEHAQEMYLTNNDDSGLRAWTQAHPSPALQAARDSMSAWQNVSTSIDDDINSSNTIQDTGSELDTRLNGINPFMVGSTVQSSPEGKNYNSAWDNEISRQHRTRDALNRAVISNTKYDMLHKKQMNEMFRPKPQAPQLLGSQLAAPSMERPISFKMPTPGSAAAARG